MTGIKNHVIGCKTMAWPELSTYELNDLKESKDRDLSILKNAIVNSGFNFPVYIWAGHRYVIDGAGRLGALAALFKEGYSLDEIPYVEIHAENKQDAKFKVLQASSRHGHITPEAAEAFIQDLDMEALQDQVNIPEIDAFLQPEEEGGEDAASDPDDAPEVDNEQQPFTMEGDVYEIGPHRLVCGDSTLIDDVAKLMRDERCDLVITDPPYNVDYKAKQAMLIKAGMGRQDGITQDIQNDKMSDEDFYAFLCDVFTNMLGFMKPGSGFYVFHADMKGHSFFTALRDSGLQICQILQWVKNVLILGRQDYHWRHEPIFYGWAPGAAHKWYSDRKQTTVLEFDKPQKNVEHPTMKPVEILQYLLKNSSQAGDIVLDLFGGSGSTMVACAQTGRVARLMEKEPKYCDVIINRMKKTFPQLKIVRNGMELV